MFKDLHDEFLPDAGDDYTDRFDDEGDYIPGYDDGELMDGDHDSAMESIGWGDDDCLAYGGGCDDF